jgi:Uma2 family endonuclease
MTKTAPVRLPIVPLAIQAELKQTATYRRFSNEEYEELTRIGVFTADDQVELLFGYLVNKMPQNDPHASTILRLTLDLVRVLPVGWLPYMQMPIRLDSGLPEPDGAVVRGGRRTYDTRKPTPEDFGIVMEVSDTTLRTDRGVKLPMYAGAVIPEYWIVNLEERQIEVYTDPNATADPPAYRSRTDYRSGQTIPLMLDGQTVAQLQVADLLP